MCCRSRYVSQLGTSEQWSKTSQDCRFSSSSRIHRTFGWGEYEEKYLQKRPHKSRQACSKTCSPWANCGFSSGGGTREWRRSQNKKGVKGTWTGTTWSSVMGKWTWQYRSNQGHPTGPLRCSIFLQRWSHGRLQTLWSALWFLANLRSQIQWTPNCGERPLDSSAQRLVGEGASWVEGAHVLTGAQKCAIQYLGCRTRQVHHSLLAWPQWRMAATSSSRFLARATEKSPCCGLEWTLRPMAWLHLLQDEGRLCGSGKLQRSTRTWWWSMCWPSFWTPRWAWRPTTWTCSRRSRGSWKRNSRQWHPVARAGRSFEGRRPPTSWKNWPWCGDCSRTSRYGPDDPAWIHCSCISGWGVAQPELSDRESTIVKWWLLREGHMLPLPIRWRPMRCRIAEVKVKEWGLSVPRVKPWSPTRLRTWAVTEVVDPYRYMLSHVRDLAGELAQFQGLPIPAVGAPYAGAEDIPPQNGLRPRLAMLDGRFHAQYFNDGLFVEDSPPAFSDTMSEPGEAIERLLNPSAERPRRRRVPGHHPDWVPPPDGGVSVEISSQVSLTESDDGGFELLQPWRSPLMVESTMEEDAALSDERKFWVALKPCWGRILNVFAVQDGLRYKIWIISKGGVCWYHSVGMYPFFQINPSGMDIAITTTLADMHSWLKKNRPLCVCGSSVSICSLPKFPCFLHGKTTVKPGRPYHSKSQDCDQSHWILLEVWGRLEMTWDD